MFEVVKTAFSSFFDLININEDRHFYLFTFLVILLVPSFVFFFLWTGVLHTRRADSAFEYNKKFHFPIKVENSWKGIYVEIQFPPVCSRCKKVLADEKEKEEEANQQSLRKQQSQINRNVDQ